MPATRTRVKAGRQVFAALRHQLLGDTLGSVAPAVGTWAGYRCGVRDFEGRRPSELLVRELPFRLDRCVFLNAGLYADQYRPRLIQRASLWPVAYSPVP